MRANFFHELPVPLLCLVKRHADVLAGSMRIARQNSRVYYPPMKSSSWVCLLASLPGILLQLQAADQPVGNPADQLPAWTTRVTSFGERADFSHDGKRILFVEKTFGDVYEVEISSRSLRPLTHFYPHLGYTRALYLVNGDILLSGPEAFDPKHPQVSRVQCFLYVLGKDLKKPPVPLRTKCSEGPAVSRRRMHIAWTHVSDQYPDEMAKGSSRILDADIVYVGGVPRLANSRVALESSALSFKSTPETQNLRPSAEEELTFSAYGHQGTEVCAVNLRTGTVTNYSSAPGQYDEPEGIFPDGASTLVECDRQNLKGWAHIDLWRLWLDGSGKLERLTYFSEFPGYKASNGVISDDGRYMAFQLARAADQAGVGYGIFLCDLKAIPRNPVPPATGGNRQ
jgi:hypothetical protein